VSPLQRALQTAAALFEGNIAVRRHVREELEERHTGYACDTRHSTNTLKARQSFMEFSFAVIGRASAAKHERERRHAPGVEAIAAVEDKQQMRARTGLLAGLLEAVPEASVALVTHKGYLRELERGPLGRPDATECGNAEVRTYKVTLRLADCASGEAALIEKALLVS